MNKKRIAIAVGIALALVGAGLWGFQYAMANAWIHYNEYDIRSEGLLRVGDLVPDLELTRTDGSGRQKLSDYYRVKPTVLAFGSYT